MKRFLLFTLSLLFIINANLVWSQSVPDHFKNFQANGNISSIEIDEANDLMYVGGSFSKIGQMVPYGAAVDNTGDIISGWPEVNGEIKVAVSDGSGGFYIGGDFTEVGGSTRNRLAHINSSGTLTAWDPDANNTVWAIVVNGSSVYVGGYFTNVGGASRLSLAEIDANGDATSWAPNPNSSVFSLHHSGSTLYVGGNFTNFNGIATARTRLASFDTSDGSITTWDPAPSSNVTHINSGGGYVYVAGNFTSISGTARNRFAEYDESTGNLTTWDPAANNTVYSTVVEGNTLFIGGSFTSINGDDRERLAAISLTSHTTLTWDPGANLNVLDLITDGTNLYVTGSFTQIGGENRKYSIAFTLSDGALSDFDLGLTSFNNALAMSGSNFYVGGAFYGIGGKARNNLAAVDLSTGEVTSWDPDVDGPVHELTLSGTTLYVGGDFDNIGASSRENVGAINTSTGLATAWNPGASAQVNGIIVNGSDIFVGGQFTQFAGATRQFLAKIGTNGVLNSTWNPAANSFIYAMAEKDNTIIVGGTFQEIGVTSRKRLAEISKSNGTLTTWNPNANATIQSIAVSEDQQSVYVGGSFTTLKGLTKNYLAAIDNNGDFTSWDPNPSNPLLSIGLSGNTAYVGGYFSTIGGMSSNRIAAIDRTTGNAQDWSIDFANSPKVIKAHGLYLYVGGISFDVEGKTNYGLTVLERINGNPFDFEFSVSSVNENNPYKSSIGTFSVSDDAGDTHTYTLVSGDGDDDNDNFNLTTGGSLRSNESLDYETQSSHSLRVRVEDQLGNAVEQIFILNVNNVIETGNDITAFSLSGSTSPAEIDNSGHTVTINLPPGSHVTSLNPTIKVSSGASVSPTGAQDFSSPVSYTITAENGSPQVWEVTVTTGYEGIYTVGTGEDFTTLSAAITALQFGDVVGDVELVIQDGYSSTAEIDLVPYDAVDPYTILIRPEDNATSINFSSTTNYIFQIHNSANGYVIDGADPVSGNKVFNFNSSEGTTVAAIYIGYSAGTTIKNCVINVTNYGVQSANNSGIQSGYLIENCDFINTHTVNTAILRGIYFQFSNIEDLTVSNCSFYNHPSSPDAAAYFPIYSKGSLTAYNNIIIGESDNFYGIQLDVDDYISDVHHNTIVLTGSEVGTGTPISVYGIYTAKNTTSTEMNVNNNLIDLHRSYTNAGYSKIGLLYHSGYTNSNADYNNISIEDDGVSAAIYVKNGGATGYTTLEQIHNVLPNTTISTPIYTDLVNHDVSLSGASLSEADLRSTLSVITDDINGELRSSNAPSKGAFEYPNNITDVLEFDVTSMLSASIDDINKEIEFVMPGASSFTQTPTFTLFSGAQGITPSGAQDFTSPVTFTVTAEDGTTEDWGVSMRYPLTGTDIISFSFIEQTSPATIDNENHTIDIVVGSPPAVNKSSLVPTITVSENATISPESGATVNFSNPVTFTVTAEDGTTEDWTITVKAPLATGTYEIASDGDFTTLQNAFVALKDGILGNVVLEVAEAQHQSTHILNRFPGTENHNLTIQPTSDATPFIISGSSSATAFQINGVENLTIDGMDKITFQNNATGPFVSIDHDWPGGTNEVCKNLVIKNCTMIGQAGGIIASAVTNLVVENVVFQGKATTNENSYQGIRFGSGSYDVNDIYIRNNSFTIGSEFESSIGAMQAIITSGFVTGDISVVNNIIDFSPATSSHLYGIYLTVPADDVEVLHNTVHFGGTNGGSDLNTEGIRLPSSSNDPINSLRVKNNIVEMQNTVTAGDKTGITYSITNTPTVEVGSNNITYSSSGDTKVYMKVNGTSYDDGNLATMQSEFPGTTNSDITFTDASNGDFSFTSSSLSDPDLRGEDVGITEDYEGLTRSTAAPSKGALEVPNIITEVLEFSITNQSGDEVIDAFGNITADVTPGSGLTNLTPVFTIMGGASISPSSGVPQNFTNPVEYTVTAEEGNTLTFDVSITELNAAPSNITLSNSTINEGLASGTTVGTLMSTDLNANDVHTYSFTTGSGDTDNGSFVIESGVLKSNEVFNYEGQGTYSVRIQSNDGFDTFSKALTITISDVSEAPTDLTLDNLTITENNEVDDVIGSFSTIDEDEGESYTYTLVSGTGDTDNASFDISGNDLIANEVFNYEGQNSYSVRVNTNDGNGGNWAESFTITIIDENEIPTALTLDVSSIQENNSISDLIGTFSTEDEDLSDSHVYNFVSGTGDTNNGLFSISSDQLLAGAAFDFESGNNYTIRVESDDQNGGVIEQQFTITITNEIEAPTDLELDDSNISESVAIGTVIGNLSTTDPDIGESYTYSLVAGTGDTDNVSFDIEGDQLVSSEVFDFETKNSYSVRIQTSDGTNNLAEPFTITILDVPPSITDIALTNDEVDENQNVGTSVGTLSTLGEDVVGTYDYFLVAGTGDEDNGSFSITDGELLTAASFDFETQSSYSIRIQTNDGEGGTFEEIFVIEINDINEQPTDITLNNNTIDENLSSGSLIGDLGSEDPDAGDSFVYSLIEGSGDTDNTLFDIVDGQLVSAVVFDYETQSTFSIRIRTDDQNGETLDKIFSISINDLNDEPTAINLDNDNVDENSNVGTLVGALTSEDQDDGDSFIYTLVSGTGDDNNSSFSISGDQLETNESFDFENRSSYSIRVQSDDQNGGLVEEVFTVSINDINEIPVVAVPIIDQTKDEGFSTLEIDLSSVFSDPDSDPLTLDASSDDPSVVTVNVVGNTLTITEVGPGTASITVTADDLKGGTVEDVFTITINEVTDPNQDPVVANAISDQTEDEGFSTLDIDLSAVFSDPDSDPLTLGASSDDPSVVTVNVVGNTLTITEVGLGTASITVTADDLNDGTADNVFTMTVNEVIIPNQDPVVANPIADQAKDEGFGSSTIDLSSTFEDADSDPLTLSATSDDELVATVSIVGTTLTITEVGVGSANITVTANDGNDGSIQDVFTVTVSEVISNSAPTVTNPISDQAKDEGFGSSTIDLSSTFEDADSDPLTLSATSDDELVATVSIVGTTLTITEVGVGSANITVTANDGNDGSIQDAFTVTVSEVISNSAPTVTNPISDQAKDEGFGSSTIDLSSTFEDADSDPLTLSATSDDGSVVTVSITGTTLSITEVGVGTATISVTAEDGNGGSIVENFEFTVNESVLGLDKESVKISLYPVPAETTLTIIADHFQNGSKLDIKIFDLNGQLHLSEMINKEDKTNVDVTSLSSGSYFLLLDKEGKTTQHRFIKH